MTVVVGGYIACPVCGRDVREPTAPVMLAHCDGVGRPCPMSGQPIGAVSR